MRKGGHDDRVGPGWSQEDKEGEDGGEWRKVVAPVPPTLLSLHLYLPICLVGVRAKSSRLGMGKEKEAKVECVKTGEWRAPCSPGHAAEDGVSCVQGPRCLAPTAALGLSSPLLWEASSIPPGAPGGHVQTLTPELPGPKGQKDSPGPQNKFWSCGIHPLASAQPQPQLLPPALPQLSDPAPPCSLSRLAIPKTCLCSGFGRVQILTTQGTASEPVSSSWKPSRASPTQSPFQFSI